MINESVNGMMFKETMRVQQNYLLRIRELLQKRLQKLPTGTVTRKVVKGKIYYYEEKNGQRSGLQNKPQLLKQYRERERLEQEVKKIEENLPLLEWMLAAYQPLAPMTAPNSAGAAQNPAASTIPANSAVLTDAQWAALKPQQNPYSTVDRDLIFSGVYYKSKSELLIAMALTSYGIEFKYEVMLKIGRRRLYPDFVIRRPKDGKLFYWEHAGKTADDDYVMKLFGRLEDYHDAQLNLWDNLILTFDSEDGGIDMDYIDKVIQLYLL